MAFPIVQGFTSGNTGGTATATHTITLPASIAAGEILFVFLAIDNNDSWWDSSDFYDEGWTALVAGSITGVMRRYAWWKYADGTEGGATYDTILNKAEEGSWMAFRISGGFAPTQANVSSSSSTPDPTSVSVADGTQDYLFLTVVATNGEYVGTTAPTNYGTLRTQLGGGTGTESISLTSAERQLNTGTSENPGAFTYTGFNDYWYAGTFAISPKVRLFLNDISTGVPDVPQIDPGAIYHLRPYNLTMPRPTLKKIGITSGNLLLNDIATTAPTVDQVTLSQKHNLSLNDISTGAPTISNMGATDSAPEGTFMFAWANGTETEFSVTHQRNDENIFAFELSHTEGDFATLTVDVVNPRVGLLSAGRKRWAWLSWDTGSGIEALFFGRLVGIPQEMEGEIIRLNFVARPQGYDDTKAALAATMRTAPYYDPMWYNEDARLESDTVLEGRPELWHIDRVTHAVTSSHVLVGEDGTVDFGTNHFYDELSANYSQTPGRIAQVQATVAWRQLAEGYVDITKKFPARIETYTYTGLLDDWPDPDTEIGGGWTVWDVSGVRLDSDRRASLTVQLRTSASWESVTLGRVDPESTAYWIEGGEQMLWTKAKVKPFMILKYEVDREYAEVATFNLYSDVQPILTDPGEDEIIQITMSANADDPIDGTPPIGDLSSYTFFHQARGRQALEHVACVARAQLMARARAIDVSCAVPFALGTQLSCRKNASVDDARLPGGTASGKVTSYVLSLNGDTGEATCVVNIGCTIGNGGSLSEAEGTPRYVDAGYVDLGYQSYSDAATYLADGDVTIQDYSDIAINDDGIRFDRITADDAVVELRVDDPASVQAAYVANNGARAVVVTDPWTVTMSKERLAELFNDVYTEIFLDVFNLEDQAPFETQFPITVSLLKLPKTIDLEST